MKTQFKVGQPMLLYGDWTSIGSLMFELSVKMQKKCGKVLFIDTLNCLNPHSKTYRSHMQKHFFKNIYCVRVDRPYDLWARLNTSENFIKLRKIGVLLVNSLNIPFVNAEEEEVLPLLKHIIHKIGLLTRKYNLVTLIGCSPHEDEKAMKAASFLSSNKEMLVMK